MAAPILNQIEQVMPPLIACTHSKFKEWTGIGGRRMANLDCLGQGPKERMLLGREIVYPRETLLEWIAGRLKEAERQDHAADC
jgi:hypothetical protein